MKTEFEYETREVELEVLGKKFLVPISVETKASLLAAAGESELFKGVVDRRLEAMKDPKWGTDSALFALIKALALQLNIEKMEGDVRFWTGASVKYPHLCDQDAAARRIEKRQAMIALAKWAKGDEKTEE